MVLAPIVRGTLANGEIPGLPNVNASAERLHGRIISCAIR